MSRHIQPGRFLKNVVPGSDVFTFNVGQPSEALNGRAPVVPSGRVVGGGSSINCKLLSFSSFLNQKLENYLQSWCTVGHPLLITMLGRVYTAIRDGVRTN